MVNHIALARRLRPRDFQSVVGQEVTIQALTNALQTGRLHHAYLFTGTRGVGKTTLARIFAKCLNCEQGISATPCGQCDTCIAIDEGRCVDVLEVDAASRTKVEDTRELLENVQYLPAAARFKIYLIDEIHMLSSHSFNALLKTLEEPPSHVKFLFATTDPQKLPITVLSRCLQFHLGRLPFSQIVSHLQTVLQAENIPFELSALEDIARGAEGSLRDALSLLEQGIAYSNSNVTAASVRKMLGLTEASRLLNLLQAILAGLAKDALQEIDALAEHTTDFASILSEFLVMFRHIAILQEAPDALEESVWQREALLAGSKTISAEEIQLYYQIGVLGQKELPYAPTSRIGFEMIILRMLAFQPCAAVFSQSESGREYEFSSAASSSGAPHLALSTLASASASMPASSSTSTSSPGSTPTSIPASALTPTSPTPPPSLTPTSPPIPTPTSTPTPSTILDWASLVPNLNLIGITRQLAEHCTVVDYSDHALHLLLEESQKPLLQTRHEDKLKQVISQYLGKNIRLKISVGKVPVGIATPAVQYQQQQETSYQAARQMMEADHKLNNLIKTFDAKIDKIEIDKVELEN